MLSVVCCDGLDVDIFTVFRLQTSATAITFLGEHWE